MRFVTFEAVKERVRGKRVAIVGSAPSAALNTGSDIDAFDLVVRVNNYKLTPNTGYKTDIHYSFYGGSIRKTREELIQDGVTLCLCKCPNENAIDSQWHRERGKQNGVDFRYIYTARQDFWFCDTYIPELDSFLDKFELLHGHIPTTGFAAILDIVACDPAALYVTGFDFFTSGVHNVDEAWRPGDPEDPIGHRPEFEREWLRGLWLQAKDTPGWLTVDAKLEEMLAKPSMVRLGEMPITTPAPRV